MVKLLKQLFLFIGAILAVASATVTLNGKFSNESIHLNGFTHFQHRTFTISDAVLTNSADGVEVNLISSTEDVRKTIGVVFKNSNLKFIPTKIFESFPALQVLYIDGQQLIDLKQNYFNGATSLRTLWAPNNEIKELGPNTFSFMGNLFTLDLSNNPIEYIHSLALSGIPRLTILNLSGTKLMSMSFDAFWYMFQLNKISFENANGNTNCLNQVFTPSPGKLNVLKDALAKKCLVAQDRPQNDDKQIIENLEKKNKQHESDIKTLQDTITSMQSATPEPCTGDSAELAKLRGDNAKCLTNVEDLNDTISDLNISIAAKIIRAEKDAIKIKNLREKLAECREEPADETVTPGPCDCGKLIATLKEANEDLTSALEDKSDELADSVKTVADGLAKTKKLKDKISQMVSGGADCGKFPLLTNAIVEACLNADVETTTKTKFDLNMRFLNDNSIIP